MTVENSIRAQSDRIFGVLQGEPGGVNRLEHNSAPAAIAHQPVIWVHSGAVYRAAIVDVPEGATVRRPDRGDRYISVMLVDQGHARRSKPQPGGRLTDDVVVLPARGGSGRQCDSWAWTRRRSSLGLNGFVT